MIVQLVTEPDGRQRAYWDDDGTLLGIVVSKDDPEKFPDGTYTLEQLEGEQPREAA